jgi:hypothetical protein
MSSSVQFRPALVLRHVAAVRETSDRMAEARAAVHQVAMDSHAYGQLCPFVPGMLSPLFGSAVDAMSEAVEALAETALKLHATAIAMDAADAGSAHRLDNAAGIELPL